MKGLPSYPNPQLNIRGSTRPGVPSTAWHYIAWRTGLQVGCCALWKVQVFNRHYEPAEGSALYICNHQSFLDPVLMSIALLRPMNYMARDTLFRTRWFARLISSCYAFPVKRGTADTGALKEALRRLKAGNQLVVFPEGTRTRDGSIGPFLPGVGMLAQRASQWVVPTLIDGAFECWPRTQVLPVPGNIAVMYGKPLTRDDMAGLGAEEVVNLVRRRIVSMQRELRQRLGRPPLPEADLSAPREIPADGTE
jgi:1-acyl-sn-glycerol-3-phosphate acyltransferase